MAIEIGGEFSVKVTFLFLNYVKLYENSKAVVKIRY